MEGDQNQKTGFKNEEAMNSYCVTIVERVAYELVVPAENFEDAKDKAWARLEAEKPEPDHRRLDDREDWVVEKIQP